MGLFNYRNLPSWVERNWLFRKLFLLRKLFLTKTRFTHNSQFAEDISIQRMFPLDFRGFFVDIGCFHPKKYNNTWRLYRRGWRGINIDLDSIKIDGFKLARPADTNIQCAISNQAGEVEFYSNGFYSLTATLDEEYARGKSGYMKKKVAAARLTDVIDGTQYKDRPIDLLSVDAEGHDLEVLKSLDFDRYAPRLIACETHHPVFNDVQESSLYTFLAEKGYSLVGWCGLTLLLGDASLQRWLVQAREGTAQVAA